MNRLEQDMIVAYLTEKRKRLEAQDKRLSPYFVEVYIDSLKATVPFLSIRAFREADVFDGRQIEKTFLSSGSTQSKRARHHFSTNGLIHYANGALEGWFHYANRADFSTSTTIFSFVPRVAEWPQSSLAAMIDMFSNRGLSVCYVDATSVCREVNKVLDTEQQIVLFGTSFHFVQLAATLGRNPIEADGKDIFIVDTGGTKGRTESYSQTELSQLIQSYFSPGARLHFHSEYGMCELSSQAYGTEPGRFICNPQLDVYAVDATDLKHAKEAKNTGFLAFIDENNHESYSAILTEDLGVALSPQEFILHGRAPDAAVKGCSLRLNPLFTFASIATTQAGTPTLNLNGNNEKKDVPKILNALDADCWDSFAKKDLGKSLADWEHPTGFSNPQLKNQTVGIVASANIPITWVFPTRYLSDAGVKAVHLFLPSLRPDDAMSARIRKQIENLARVLAPQLACDVILYREKISENNLQNFKKLLVFGQSETIDLYNNRFSNVVGFGDVINHLEVNKDDSITAVAENCVTWFGRGCLTPTAISNINFSAAEFASVLSELFLQRAKAMTTSDMEAWLQSAHVFDTIDLRAQLQALGLSPETHIHRKAPVTVVDLRGSTVTNSSIEWGYGGSGLVYLVDKVDAAFSNFSTAPTLQSPHCGKSWAKWLG